MERLWVENVSRDLNGGGIEITWGQVIPGRKEGQCKVMAVGLSWACSRKGEQNPVAGADGAEESVKDELRGGASLHAMQSVLGCFVWLSYILKL